MPKESTARYVVEIRDGTGASLLLTAAEWTDSERKVAMAAILRLAGHKPENPDPELLRLEEAIRLARRRLEWIGRTVPDLATIKAATDICAEAIEAVRRI